VATDFAAPEARKYLIGAVAGNPLSAFARTSPIEELISTGFGTATHRDGQSVDGKGGWADGRWQVVFVRDLASVGPDAPVLAGKAQIPTAFAVWNGTNQEVGARKQLSTFVTVSILKAPVPGPALPTGTAPARDVSAGYMATMGYLLILPVLGGIAGWITYQRNRIPRDGGEK
jgi:hypothetical protein